MYITGILLQFFDQTLRACKIKTGQSILINFVTEIFLEVNFTFLKYCGKWFKIYIKFAAPTCTGIRTILFTSTVISFVYCTLKQPRTPKTTGDGTSQCYKGKAALSIFWSQNCPQELELRRTHDFFLRGGDGCRKSGSGSLYPNWNY